MATLQNISSFDTKRDAVHQEFLSGPRTADEFEDGSNSFKNETIHITGNNTAVSSLNVTKFQDFWEVKVASFVDLYVEAILLFGGIFCNSIIMIMFCGKKYQKKSGYSFIHCLAFIDFLLLSIVLMIHWVNYNFEKGNKNIYLCRVTVFLGRQLFDFEAWVIAAMSVFRWISVTYPLRAKFWCTVFRARIVICTSAVATILKTSTHFGWLALPLQ